MANTTFSGPVRVGTDPNPGTTNIGKLIAAQTASFSNVASGATFTLGTNLPAGARVYDIIVDFTTGANGTTPTFSIGYTGANTQFVNGATAPASAGRASLAAQLQVANLLDSGTGGDRPLNITFGGTGVTVNAGTVTVTYVQNGAAP